MLNSGMVKAIVGVGTGLVLTGVSGYACGKRKGAKDAYMECTNMLKECMEKLAYENVKEEQEKGDVEETVA